MAGVETPAAHVTFAKTFLDLNDTWLMLLSVVPTSIYAYKCVHGSGTCVSIQGLLVPGTHGVFLATAILF
jgi:hypothetical protein